MRMSGGHSLADGSTAATPYDVPSGNIGNESLPAGRKDGPTVGRVKKCPVDTFLVRGRVLWFGDASRRDVDTNQNSIAVLQLPLRVSAFLILRKGLEDRNPTARWAVGHRRLDGDASLPCAVGTWATSPFRQEERPDYSKRALPGVDSHLSECYP